MITTHTGDNLELLPTLAPASVHLIVTSPPYYGLRDYNIPPSHWPEISYSPIANLEPITIPAMTCVLGNEADPLEYIGHLIHVLRLCRHPLRLDGLAVVNLGDCMANDSKWGGTTGGKHAAGTHGTAIGRRRQHTGLPPKSKTMIPHRFALAAQADGWIVRQDSPWPKANGMPESVADRPSTMHEYVFMLARQPRYFWDMQPIRMPSVRPGDVQTFGANKGRNYTPAPDDPNYRNGTEQWGRTIQVGETRYYRSTDTWRSGLETAIAAAREHLAMLEHIKQHGGALLDSDGEPSAIAVNPRPYSGAHFAVYPPELIRPYIRAGSPEKACPHCGAGWKHQIEPTGHQNKRVPSHYPGQRRPDKTSSAGWAPATRAGDLAPTCACEDNDGSARGIVLDPYAGSGTTGEEAERQRRDAILIELNTSYTSLQEERTNGVQIGMF